MQAENYQQKVLNLKLDMYPSASPPSPVFPMMGYAEQHSRDCGFQKVGRLPPCNTIVPCEKFIIYCRNGQDRTIMNLASFYILRYCSFRSLSSYSALSSIHSKLVRSSIIVIATLRLLCFAAILCSASSMSLFVISNISSTSDDSQ